MTPAQWKKAGETFHAALDRDEGVREHWVRSVCEDDPEVLEEVLSLLKSDALAGSGFIERKLQPAVQSFLEDEAGRKIPKRAGPYRLVRELGRGGMGAVYLAERDDEEYRTEVAVKLVRRGMDTDLVLARFYRERQTLARLQHPSIARLHDGGTTPEGYPYIVMEYVDGKRITDYCRDEGLSVAERVKLFLQVANAVDYAHRNFVVHRDLKPGNIMVDKSGTVKLLDFGVCKLLQTPDAFGGSTTDSTIDASSRFLTPDYASPEQIQGEAVTVTSDVYSAAAVLYELLTGEKPHRFADYTLRGIEKEICETGVRTPSLAAPNSALARQLRGDLDNILLCALDKEPTRRYESMERFAEDLRRYLADEPIRARPDTLRYRAQKFVRRRHGLVAATAAVLAALGAGIYTSMRSARIANDNLAMVRQLSNTFVFEVYDAVSELPGSTRARQIVVETGLKYLNELARNASGDAELQRELAAAYRRIGDVQGNVMRANLGNTTAALESYQKALSLLEGVRRKDPDNRAAAFERVRLHARIGSIREYTRNQQDAIASFRQAAAEAEAELKRRPRDAEMEILLADIYADSARATRASGRYSEARDQYVRALELLERHQQTHADQIEFQDSIATALAGVGLCDVRLGRPEEALKNHRLAAEWRERIAQKDPSNVTHQRNLMFVYSHIGDVLANPNLTNLGDAKGATEAYERMVQVARKIHEADPADQRARGDYGIALSRVAALLPDSRAAERVLSLQQAIALLSEVVRVNPEDTFIRAELAYNYNFLGDAYSASGDEGNALMAYRKSLDIAETLRARGVAAVHAVRVMLYRKLGDLTARRGDRRQALDLAERSLALTNGTEPFAENRPAEVQRLLVPRGMLAIGTIHASLAEGKARRPGDSREARKWLEQSIREFRTVEKLPAFTLTLRREMRLAEKTLEGLP
jgi:serine/threonine protein kinase